MTQDQFNLRYSFDRRNDRLGTGAFGTVYKAYDNVLNLYKAVKIAKVQNINGKEFSLLSEYKNVKNIPPHTNIANYEAVYQFETNYELLDFAIMQYYEDGTLKDLLKRHSLSDNQKLNIIKGLLSGVSHLHKAGVIHRDLKAGNILIARDQKGEFIPKISDFGLSKLIEFNNDESLSNSFQGGSIDYSSPEQLMGLKLLPNTDIWSLGVMIFEIFTGKKPFQGDENSVTPEIKRHTTLVKIFNGQISELINQCPFPYSDLLPLCLRTDPYQRIKSVEQIFKYVEYPELIKSSDLNDSWDDEETIVFSYERQDKNNYPIIFNKFLESIGIKPNPESNIEIQDDAFIIHKRKEIIDKKNEEFQKLKNHSQQYITEGDQLLLDGYFDEAIQKFQTSLNFYISEDVRLKVTELQIQIQKAEKLIVEANNFKNQAHLDKAKDLVLKSLEIYPQFQKAITLKNKIEELIVLQNKTNEFNRFLKDAEKNLEQDELESALFNIKEALIIFPENKIAIEKQGEITKRVNEQILISKKNDLLKKAALFEQKGQLSEALSILMDVSELTPGDSFVEDQIHHINERITSEEKLSEFNNLKSQAEDLFAQKEFVKALHFFHQCQSLFIEDQIIIDRIKDVNDILKLNQLEQDYSSNITNANKYFDQGNYKEAIRCYQNALNLKPDQTLPLEKIRISNGKLAEINSFNNLLKDGDHYLESGDLVEALSAYNKAKIIFSDHDTLNQKILKLEDHLKAIEKEKKDRENNLSFIQKYKTQAEQYLSDKQYSDAIHFYEKAGNIYPLEHNFKDKIKEILLLIKKEDEQIAYDKLIQQAADLCENAEYQNAIAQYHKALALKKDDPYCTDQIRIINEKFTDLTARQKYEAIISEADIYLKDKKWDRAIATYERAKSLLPGNIYPEQQISLIYSKIKEEEKETEKLDSFKNLIAEGDNHLKNKDFEKAIYAYQNADALFQNDVVENKIKSASFALKKWKEELSKKQEAEKNQQTYKSLYEKAKDAEKSLDFLKALSLYENILEIQPNDKHIISALNTVKDKIGKQKIIDKFNHCIELSEEKNAEGDYSSSLKYLTDAESLLPLTSSLKVFKESVLKLQHEQEVQSEIENLIQEGKLFYEKKDLVKALGSFEQAFKRSNNKDKVAEKYIYTLKTELEQSKVEDEIKSAIQKAENQYLVGNIKDTIDIYHKLNKKYPDQPGISSRLVELTAELEKVIQKEKETQANSRFHSLIELTNNAVKEKKYKLAHKKVSDAIKLQPANEDALKLKTEIEKLLQDEKDRIVPWYTILSNFGNANRRSLLIGIGLMAILAASYQLLTKPKSEKQRGQLEIFKNAEGLFGCKLNEEQIVPPSFDTLYMDSSQGLQGVRNASLFSIKSDGAISFISYSKRETPAILTKEWIESITDIDELYSLINQFPNNPLTPSINKRIKLLEEQNESKKYREILNIPNLETNWKEKLAALEAFSKEYPRSKFLKEIKAEMTNIKNDMVKNLSEVELFNAAKNGNSISLLEDFIKTYPKSKYFTEANSLLKIIKDEQDNEAWKSAEKDALEKNIIQPLDAYLNQYTIHANEAKALKIKIGQIIEETRIKIEKEEKERREHALFWQGVEQRRNLDEVKRFINEHPGSLFKSDAEALKKELETSPPPDLPKEVVDIESKMANLGGGSFTLGCDKGSNCDDDASPAVRISIKNVAICKYEVTQAEYEAIMGVNPSYFKDCPSCPVENVSFDDAMEYIRKLNTLKGNPYTYRLPTEAEWEYFALANKNTIYSGGDNIDPFAIYGTRSGTGKVTSKKPNAFGLYHMTGNVAEWCVDYYVEDAYTKYKGRRVTEGDKSKNRVVRGGSYKDNARNSRVKKRSALPESEKADWIGFRLVRELK